MAWLVIANDSEKGPDIRANQNVMDDMWQFELQHKDKIVVAGSLRKDDKETKNGSVLLLDVETREEAEAILAADPSTQSGLRGEVSIRWLNIAILDTIEQP